MGMQSLGTKPNTGSARRILAAVIMPCSNSKRKSVKPTQWDIPLGYPVQPSLLLQPHLTLLPMNPR